MLKSMACSMHSPQSISSCPERLQIPVPHSNFRRRHLILRSRSLHFFLLLGCRSPLSALRSMLRVLSPSSQNCPEQLPRTIADSGPSFKFSTQTSDPAFKISSLLSSSGLPISSLCSTEHVEGPITLIPELPRAAAQNNCRFWSPRSNSRRRRLILRSRSLHFFLLLGCLSPLSALRSMLRVLSPSSQNCPE